MANFWEVLGIEPTKDLQHIKQAYAILAKKYHPEQYPEEFLKLRNAYEAAIEYASSEKELFYINDEYEQKYIVEEQKNFEEEIYKEEFTEFKKQYDYWDLSKLNDKNDIDYNVAYSKFLDLYKNKKCQDAKQWYTYFTSYEFLEVWREKEFTRYMLQTVYENIEKLPINKVFFKCLNAVYGCVVYNDYYFDEVQFKRNILFDGFVNIEKILRLYNNIGKLTQNDLSMFISFCEYRMLISFAEENEWNDTSKIKAEYIFYRYVMTYIKEKCVKNEYTDVERYYLGIRLITDFIRKYDLPNDIYKYIWQIYSLESAVNGRSKIYYGDIREILIKKNKNEYEISNKNYKKVYDLYYIYERSLAKNEFDISLIEDFFAQQETEELLRDRHFIYYTLFYWIAKPQHLSFLNKLYDFYSQNTDVFKIDEILSKIKKRKKEVYAENAFEEDKKNNNYSMCNVEHRPFLRYWLNIGFYRAINFSDVLKENMLFSEKWANSFGNRKYKLSLIPYKNKLIEIKFHRRYAEYFYNGKVMYKPFIQWYAVENIENDTLFFMLLPAVIPFIDDEETYNIVLKNINNHFKNTSLTEENITQLSKGIIKMLFCGSFIINEIDDVEEKYYFDCNAYEFYGENETNLYVCKWSKYSQELCFYEQKLYDRVLMENGIYKNILTENDALSLANELLLSQCSKTVVDISYLKIMPEYMYVQPKGAKSEENFKQDITESILISALDRFAKNNINRIELKWAKEEVVLINTGDKCACFYFNDIEYTMCKLLSMPKLYYTVDSKDVIHVPFLLGKLANYEIFNSPKMIVMKLCSLLFQFGTGEIPNNRVYGDYVWSQNVYLYGKYDAYILDKMKLGDFSPEKVITDFNIKRKIIIPKFPTFMEVLKVNKEKYKLDINPTTKGEIQTVLQMYLQNSIKYLHLCWETKKSSNIYNSHIFLIQEEKKYVLYYLNDKDMSAYCLIWNLSEYLKPEGQSPIVDIYGVPMNLYSIHKDIIRIRFFLSLLLDSIENPELILNKVGEFTDGTKVYKHNMTYNELYNRLVEIYEM